MQRSQDMISGWTNWCCRCHQVENLNVSPHISCGRHKHHHGGMCHLNNWCSGHRTLGNKYQQLLSVPWLWACLGSQRSAESTLMCSACQEQGSLASAVSPLLSPPCCLQFDRTVIHHDQARRSSFCPKTIVWAFLFLS